MARELFAYLKSTFGEDTLARNILDVDEAFEMVETKPLAAARWHLLEVGRNESSEGLGRVASPCSVAADKIATFRPVEAATNSNHGRLYASV